MDKNVVAVIVVVLEGEILLQQLRFVSDRLQRGRLSEFLFRASHVGDVKHEGCAVVFRFRRAHDRYALFLFVQIYYYVVTDLQPETDSLLIEVLFVIVEVDATEVLEQTLYVLLFDSDSGVFH